MLKISPTKIKGNWVDGYALDLHTASSEFIGYDEYGHPQFDTKHTEIGEYLYRLKSRQDKDAIEELVLTSADFVTSQKWPIDLIVSVPPSTSRSFQPVVVLAESLAKVLKIKYCAECVQKTRETPQLKSISDITERTKILNGAFRADSSKIEGTSVLLFDDLYRSGATLNEVAITLQRDGKASKIYALTLTRTRIYR